MKGRLNNTRFMAIRGSLAILAAGCALVAAPPSGAATSIPRHDSPEVRCYDDGSGRIGAVLPTWVETRYYSEKIAVRFHLNKKVNGVWKHDLADPAFYTNFATFGGALNGGWLLNGNTSLFGSTMNIFNIRDAGEYKVSMEMWWYTSGAYTLEWAGQHSYYDPWNFIDDPTGTCSYG